MNAEEINDRAKLIMHRLISRKVRRCPEILETVRKDIRKQSQQPKTPDYVFLWNDLLQMDVNFIARKLVERSDEMTKLRISSPLYQIIDLSDVQFRRRIWKKAKMGRMSLRTFN